MRIAIVGSRDYADLEAVRRYVRSLPEHCTVVSGGARGVDTVAAEEASRRRDLDIDVHPALWSVYGKSAGYRRNVDIVNAADEVIAFWDGKSSGTGHTIRIAKQMGKPVRVFAPGEYK
jgi:predicted Rossmann fold nucleotide-binding protein DprA/Smf involved in DNA uptake